MRVQVSLNPVLVKELRGRMRGPRAYLFLTATLALLGGVSYGLYRLAAFVTQSSYGGIPQGALIGQGVFTGLVLVALAVICTAAPFLTAGAIGGEWERKTIDLLLATPLGPSSLLFGKLVAALSFVALVLLAAIPMASLSFVFGGVPAEDMLKALALLLAFAVTYSVMGLFFSALFRRTGPALVASYVVLALFIFGTVFAVLVHTTIGRAPPPAWLLAPNPFTAMASMLMAGGNAMPLAWLPGMDALGSLLGIMGGGGMISSRLGMPVSPLQGAATPLWHYTVGLYAWLTAAMYLVSTQLVRPVRRFRLRPRTWALVACLLLASLLAFPVTYGPFTPGRMLSWLHWLRSRPVDLVADGTFAAPLEEAWQVSARAKTGQVVQTSADSREVTRLSRRGKAPAEIGISQAISQTVPADGWLQVRAVLRVLSQDTPMCGEQGDACPLTIKLTYEDADGRQHEWQQGFFATPGSYMPFCTACETRQAHIQVPAGQWYTFESPNLLEVSGVTTEWLMQGMPYYLPPPPRVVHSITITAAGTSYEAEVAEVALIVREGRPLPRPGRDAGATGVPTPAPVFDMPVRVAPAMPVPTAAPPPTPVPTATPPDA